MPRPSRSRGARSTRSPSSHLFSGYLIETYNHVDDLPVLSDAPKKRPRHATRGAAAAERRQESGPNGLPRRSSFRTLRPDPVPMKPPPRSRDELTKALKHHDCTVCLRRGTVWMLLKCIRCARCVHSYCLNPPQTLQPKRGVWTCEPCARAPPPQKRQAGRALRHAVKTFPFLVPHTYLDAMTDDVSAAAAADVRTDNRHPAQKERDFGKTTTTDPPEPADPTENTVVLKVESDESELDDLRPLAELRHPAAKAEEVFEDDHQAHALREPKRASTAPLPADAPKVRSAAGTVQRASTSASPEILPAGSVQNGPGPLRASSAPAVSGSVADAIRPGAARGAGRGGRRGRAPRAGKERRVGEATKPASSGMEVWVKLRRKPPAPVFKERAKHVMDERGKAEMCRRLAKARAKKAELRAIAMREKAAAEKAAADKAATEKGPAGQQVAPLKREDVVSDPGKAHMAQMGAVGKGAGSTAGAPKIGMPNIGAAVAQIAAMQGVVTPMAAARNGLATLGTSRASEPARNGLASQATSRVGVARTRGENGNGPALGVASPLAQASDRTNVPGRFARNDERPIRPMRRHDGAPPMRRHYQREVKVSAADPYGTGSANAATADVVELRDNSPQHSSVRMDRDVTMKAKKRLYDGQLDSSSIRVEREKKTAEFMHHSASTSGTVGNSRRRERPTQSPSHGQLSDKERSGEISCAEVDAESVDEKDGAVKFTPEQRTVAKMANLFESSMRSGDSNPNAVSANWGKIKLDAKNEALLTLAKGQKGSIGKRRSSAGMSSSSLDKDIRSAKTHQRTENVPESERKRMQATAMMASGRARGTAGPSTTETAATVSRKASIGRLLIHPSAVASTEVRKSTHESVSRGRAHQVFDVDQSAMIHMDNRQSVNDGMDLSRMGDAVAGFKSKIQVSDVPDFHASQLRAARTPHVDVASGDNRAGRRAQGLSQGSQWEDVPSEYESSRILSRSVPIPSSQSGSQSEPGSATARRLTSVQTLKRPKKRHTLATLVTNRKRPPELEPARVVEVMDPVATEPTSVGSRPSWSETRRQGEVIKRPGQSQSSHDHEEHNSALGPSYLEPTPDGKSRRIANFGGQPMEPPAEPQSFKKRSRNDRCTGRNYGIDSVQDVGRSPIADTGYSASAEGQYRNSSVSRGARSSGGAAQSYHESLNTQNQMSPLRQGIQGASHSSSQGPSPVYPGDYHRGPLADDPMRFSESRRLRRSVAPTVPTATRRFQYEQGRQLARFTSAAPSEQQQAYSAARRSRTQQRHPEPGLQRTGTEWDAARENHGTTGQPVTSYPAYSHQGPTGSTAVLNHHLIAQEGARPQLAPVVYQSDSPRRNQTRNGLTWSAPSISRLNESAHRPSSQSHRAPIAQDYHQDYPRSAEQSSYPFSRFRALPQSRVPPAPVQPRPDFDRTREPSRPLISRLRDDGTGEPIDPRRSSYSRDVNSFGRTSGFSEHRGRSGEFAPSARAIGEYIDDRAPAQAADQAQPARTDPSLKNLLG